MLGLHPDKSRGLAHFFLALIAATLGYAVLTTGGPIAQSHGPLRVPVLIAASLIGLVGTLYGILLRPKFQLAGHLKWLIYGLPLFSLLQVLPLPIRIVRLISPARADLADALSPVMPPPAWITLSVAPSATLYHFLLFAACAILFWLVFDLCVRLSATPWRTVLPLVFMGAVKATIGLLQSATSPDTIATGTFSIRNHFAGFLEMVLPFAVAFPLARLAQGAGRKLNGVFIALIACFGFGISALLLAAIVASLSRMGFIGAVSSLLFVVVIGASYGFTRRRIAGVLVGSVFVAFAALLVLPSARLVARFGEIEKTKEARSPVKETLDLVAAYPLFGCGLGGYESAFLKFKRSNADLNQDYAHNDYLQYLAELGLVGFMIAAIPLIMILIKLPTCFRQTCPDQRWLGIACAGSTLAIGLHSFVDFNLYVPANLFTLAWVLGESTAIGMLCSRAPSAALQPASIIFVPERPSEARLYP